MDFAKRQLEKYGWKEGQGLGKHATGIANALKPKIKLDTYGIDYNASEEFTHHWWNDAFNSACSNFNVEHTKDGVKVATVAEPLDIPVVTRAQIDRDKLKFSSFVKRETLTKSGVKHDTPMEEVKSKLPRVPAALSDEQLFEACGGLTAHKGARHGLTLSGKLQRVKEQEEALLKSTEIVKRTIINDDIPSKVKRKKTDNLNFEEKSASTSKKKKKDKKKGVDEDEAQERIWKVSKKNKTKHQEEKSPCDGDTKNKKGVCWTETSQCQEDARRSRKKKKKRRDLNGDSSNEETVSQENIEETRTSNSQVMNEENERSGSGKRKDKKKIKANELVCESKKKKKRKTEEQAY